jgi:hypothetical protein
LSRGFFESFTLEDLGFSIVALLVGYSYDAEIGRCEEALGSIKELPVLDGDIVGSNVTDGDILFRVGGVLPLGEEVSQLVGDVDRAEF